MVWSIRCHGPWVVMVLLRLCWYQWLPMPDTANFLNFIHFTSTYNFNHFISTTFLTIILSPSHSL